VTDNEKSFIIVHGVFYNQTINENSVKSIKAAWDLGITDIAVYFYPCVPGSSYSIGKSTVKVVNHVQVTEEFCASAQSQIDGFVSYLRNHGIYFEKRVYNYLLKAYQYSILVPSYDTSDKSRIYIQTLYVNIVDTTPNLYFSQSHWKNVHYLRSLVEYASSLQIEVGIYSTKTDWQKIMCDITQNGIKTDFTYNFSLPKTYDATTYINLSKYVNPFQKLKLWTPRYDRSFSMDFYGIFADWSKPYVKQVSGGSTDQRRIGQTRICTDFKEV
jgi:hypothetical protein